MASSEGCCRLLCLLRLVPLELHSLLPCFQPTSLIGLQLLPFPGSAAWVAAAPGACRGAPGERRLPAVCLGRAFRAGRGGLFARAECCPCGAVSELPGLLVLGVPPCFQKGPSVLSVCRLFLAHRDESLGFGLTRCHLEFHLCCPVGCGKGTECAERQWVSGT